MNVFAQRLSQNNLFDGFDGPTFFFIFVFSVQLTVMENCLWLDSNCESQMRPLNQLCGNHSCNKLSIHTLKRYLQHFVQNGHKNVLSVIKYNNYATTHGPL